MPAFQLVSVLHSDFAQDLRYHLVSFLLGFPSVCEPRELLRDYPGLQEGVELRDEEAIWPSGGVNQELGGLRSIAGPS